MSITTVSAVPKYRHHKGTDQAFIQIKGRRHYLGKWNSQKSKERYAAFIAELAVRPTALPMLKAESQITITELAAAYWEFVQAYYVKNGKPSGWQDHIRLMLRKVRDTYGLTPRRRLRPLEVEGYPANPYRCWSQPGIHQ